MQYKVHLAIQIIPLNSKIHPYEIIDKAIEEIDRAGLRYEVGPMETVIEGQYEQVMEVAKRAQQACLNSGANELVVNMKLHLRKDGDVTWEEKMKKYS